MSELTEIQKFYVGKTIFMTGGTGFIGKSLVEKLLRSCSVTSIILILRGKSKKTFEQRLAEYFNDVLFDKMKENQPEELKKVIFIEGNISLENFGLSPKNYKLIIERTNIVFHVAAIIKFFEPLYEAVPLNIIATKTIIEMAKEMKNLNALVHVSTAYAFCNKDKIDETIQSVPYKPEFLIELVNNMNQTDLDKITPMLLGNIQNTYLLTKQTPECYISRAHEHLPVSIYRPVSISPTYREPIPGWTNNFFAAFGVGICISIGATKIMKHSGNIVLPLIPADIVANK